MTKFKPSNIEKNFEKDLEKRGVLENKKENWEIGMKAKCGCVVLHKKEAVFKSNIIFGLLTKNDYFNQLNYKIKKNKECKLH